MKQNIFEKNVPSLSYMKIRWPKSIFVIRKYLTCVKKTPNFERICYCFLRDLQYKNIQLFRGILKTLSKKCSMNFTSNKYHDQHHFKSVLLISYILTKKKKINDFEKILLLILSLAHDMDHQGKRIIKKHYYQEEKTLKALQFILFKKLLSFKKWQRIKKIILNTFFLIKPADSMDLIEKIILSSDVASGILFGCDSGLKMASKLKHESNLSTSSIQLYKEFLKKLDERNLEFLLKN